MGINGHGNEERDQQLANLEQIPIGTRVEFLDAQVVVSRAANVANRLITIIDRHTATAYQMELTPGACRAIGRELMSVIEIAGTGEMPPQTQ